MKLLTHNLDNLIRILQVVYSNFEPWKYWESFSCKSDGLPIKIQGMKLLKIGGNHLP